MSPEQGTGQDRGDDHEADLDRRARAHVDTLRGFYRHLAAYVTVNLFLLALNLLTAPDQLWFYWPLLGWGIGLAAHAVRTFAMPSFDRDWEERKVAYFKDRDPPRRNGGA